MSQLASVELGIGAWAWGDTLFWGFGDGYADEDIREAFDEIVSHDNILIDTAEVYGLGKSEEYIGEFASQSEKTPLIATKFFPYPWRLREDTVLDALRRSLERLNISQATLYQIHQPFHVNSWIKGLVRAAEEGLTRAVGVSNYNADQTQRAYDALSRYGLALASNQVKYSLLDRRIEKNGLLALCKRLGVRVIAYSPLEQGLLTGKYTPDKPPPGIRGMRYQRQLEAVQPLIETMREIGKAYAENGRVKTPAQVAINWCICKGTIPIPGAKTVRQASQNIGASGWRLGPEEIAILDSLSRDVNRKLESKS